MERGKRRDNKVAVKQLQFYGADGRKENIPRKSFYRLLLCYLKEALIIINPASFTKPGIGW